METGIRRIFGNWPRYYADKRYYLCRSSGFLPMHESSLGVHEIELMIESGPRIHDRRRVAETAHRSFHTREIPTRYNGRWLIIYSYLLTYL